MSDRYLEFTHSSFGQTLSAMLGLPKPPRLKRASDGFGNLPFQSAAALVGAFRGARHAAPVLVALRDAGAVARIEPAHPGLKALKAGAAEAGVALVNNPANGEGEAAALIVFDASGAESPADLRQLYDFFQPLMSGLPSNARIVLIADRPGETDSAGRAACAAAVRGFVRSLAKEVGRKGTIVNLLHASRDAGPSLAGALRFFLSHHSAFITGQVLDVTGAQEADAKWVAPLDGKTALVTGAARGIGAAIAATLAREGAHVVGLDRVEEEGHLAATLSPINGSGMTLDITDPDAAQRIGDELKDRFGGVDVVVHNAGITRDKLLRNMKPQFWDMVLDVNLGAIVRINEQLTQGVINDGGRMVCVSSIGGIAGNAGQTNYGATKAGVIGYVQALAEELADRPIAVNAVAPGFIETQMTASMPVMHREVGRRLNSLSQGGMPQDIAETVAFLGSHYAAGINGQTLRVCGQNWVGA